MKTTQASGYLHKSEYLALGPDGSTTAFFHSKGEAFWLYTATKSSMACRNCRGEVKLALRV
jgi:hypothetical protein